MNPRENCSVFKKILPKLEIHLIHDETAMFDMPGGGGGNGGIWGWEGYILVAVWYNVSYQCVIYKVSSDGAHN